MPTAPAGAPPPTFVTRIARVAWALAACVVAFAALEGLLRVTGIGADERSTRLAYQEVWLPALEPGERADGTAVWHTADPRVPYQSVAREKRPGTLRVFTFGGSATAGLGFSPNVTFARHLEELFRGSHPEHTIEVVNLGIVAIASKQVRLLVEDVLARYEPDVLVVYSGNNEFLELHAIEYARRTGGALGHVRRAIASTHLVRAMREVLVGAPRPTAPVPRRPDDGAHERLTEARIVREVRVTPEQVERVQGAYEANLNAIASAARGAGVPLVLCSVAANAEWRGREDLGQDWMRALPGAPTTPAEAFGVLEAELARQDLDALERWELLYRRATLRRAHGNVAGARADFGAALDADPHLRRATTRHATSVRRAAEAGGALHLDVPALFAATASDGIVGFEHFYDYVHFTPRGAAELASGVHAALANSGALPRGLAVDGEAYWRRHGREVAALERDFFDARLFLGIGFDAARLVDRDLWKYDALLYELDARLAADPNDAAAHFYRGNMAAFRQDGAATAEAHYRRALELLGDDAVVRANLERLLAERPVAED